MQVFNLVKDACHESISDVAFNQMCIRDRVGAGCQDHTFYSINSTECRFNLFDCAGFIHPDINLSLLHI